MDPSATQAGGFFIRQSNEDTHFGPSETESTPAHAQLIPGRRQADAVVRHWADGVHNGAKNPIQHRLNRPFSRLLPVQ